MKKFDESYKAVREAHWNAIRLHVPIWALNELYRLADENIVKSEPIQYFELVKAFDGEFTINIIYVYNIDGDWHEDFVQCVITR